MFGKKRPGQPSLRVTGAFHSMVLWGGRALESKGVEELHATFFLIWHVNSLVQAGVKVHFWMSPK